MTSLTQKQKELDDIYNKLKLKKRIFRSDEENIKSAIKKSYNLGCKDLKKIIKMFNKQLQELGIECEVKG